MKAQIPILCFTTQRITQNKRTTAFITDFLRRIYSLFLEVSFSYVICHQPRNIRIYLIIEGFCHSYFSLALSLSSESCMYILAETDCISVGDIPHSFYSYFFLTFLYQQNPKCLIFPLSLKQEQYFVSFIFPEISTHSLRSFS